MARHSNRQILLATGQELVFRDGFAGASVRDITQAAGVPQGCFANHFASKEAFGLAVIDRYFEGIRGVLARTLLDETLAPLERIPAYLDAATERHGERGWRNGCLLGNMGLEMANQSEAMRARLMAIFAEWKAPFVIAVQQAQRAGAVRADLDPDALADFILAGWHGAVMRMKVERSRRPLDGFRSVLFQTALAPAHSSGSVVNSSG